MHVLQCYLVIVLVVAVDVHINLAIRRLRCKRLVCILLLLYHDGDAAVEFRFIWKPQRHKATHSEISALTAAVPRQHSGNGTVRSCVPGVLVRALVSPSPWTVGYQPPVREARCCCRRRFINEVQKGGVAMFYCCDAHMGRRAYQISLLVVPVGPSAIGSSSSQHQARCASADATAAAQLAAA